MEKMPFHFTNKTHLRTAWAASSGCASLEEVQTSKNLDLIRTCWKALTRRPPNPMRLYRYMRSSTHPNDTSNHGLHTPLRRPLSIIHTYVGLWLPEQFDIKVADTIHGLSSLLRSHFFCHFLVIHQFDAHAEGPANSVESIRFPANTPVHASAPSLSSVYPVAYGELPLCFHFKLCKA